MKFPLLIVFDFDGVLTDNRVIVSEDGTESVICNRADGLAFDMFRKANIPCIILSTETSKVVAARAEKLKIPVVQKSKDKVKSLKAICLERSISLSDVWYVGNDLNDLEVMKIVGTTFCPSDSHPLIKEISQHELSKKGGLGVAREIMEKFLELHKIIINTNKY
jgi:3-deoxy-D-manno-octulosonate 8-phosphate phosphatase (KDO 8-P phosphatase)